MSDDSPALADARPIDPAIAARFSHRYRWYVVLLLTVGYTMYTADRTLLGVLLEPIKQQFGASDSEMGFISLLAAMAYALSILPLGLLADRVNRRNLLFVILCGWSAATMLSGAVRYLAQLAVTQMLVSANEAGGSPTMNSMISDLFERARRGLPIGLWYCGISLGAFVGFSGGGYLADRVGWQMTFVLLGAPGIVLGLLVLLTVREAPRGMSDGVVRSAAARRDLPATIAFLKDQKAIQHSIFGQCLTGLAQMGPIAWLVSFFHRSHGASFAVAGVTTGIIFLVTGLLSAPIGGFLMDRLSARDVRWNAWLCALMMVGSAVAFGGIYTMPTLALAFAALFCWQFIINAVSPVTVTTISNLAPAQFRGLAISLGFLLFNLLGVGLGSQVIGVASDWFANRWGLGPQDALRYACLIAIVFHIWGALHYMLAARHMKAGYARARIMENTSRDAAIA